MIRLELIPRGFRVYGDPRYLTRLGRRWKAYKLSRGWLVPTGVPGPWKKTARPQHSVWRDFPRGYYTRAGFLSRL